MPRIGISGLKYVGLNLYWLTALPEACTVSQLHTQGLEGCSGDSRECEHGISETLFRHIKQLEALGKLWIGEEELVPLQAKLWLGSKFTPWKLHWPQAFSLFALPPVSPVLWHLEQVKDFRGGTVSPCFLLLPITSADFPQWEGSQPWSHASGWK